MYYYIKICKLVVESEQNDYFSKNDLYVKINYIQDNKVKFRKTQVVYNNNKPIWNEIFLLECIPNKLEILLFEKGKFMDKLLYSTKLDKINNVKKITINKIELYHGSINIENKEKIDKLVNEIDKLKIESENKDIFINKLTTEKDNTIIDYKNKITKLQLKNSVLNEQIENKIEIINNIKKIIN